MRDSLPNPKPRRSRSSRGVDAAALRNPQPFPQVKTQFLFPASKVILNSEDGFSITFDDSLRGEAVLGVFH